MKKAIFITAFVTLVSFSTNAQKNRLTYLQQILCDIQFIQDHHSKNANCITTSVEVGGEAGYTRTIIEKEKGYYKMGVIGPEYVQPREVKRKEQVPSTYYTYTVFKNTCSVNAYVKAIRKRLLSTIQYFYEDASFVVGPGESEKRTIKYVDDYDLDVAKAGTVYAYKNPFMMPSEVYEEYLNSVIKKNEGRLIVTPTSDETAIYLRPGDKVNITAEGSIELGVFAGSGGPDGITGYTDYSFTPNAKHGALIYTHSGVKGWQLMGSRGSFTASGSGLFRLTVNDNSTDDDKGQFVVDYEIIRAN